jgi:hypothetical protein
MDCRHRLAAESQITPFASSNQESITTDWPQRGLGVASRDFKHQWTFTADFTGFVVQIWIYMIHDVIAGLELSDDRF